MLRKGLEEGFDVSVYLNKKFTNYQMAQIRLGLLHGLDVSQYAKTEISAKQMRKIREKLENEQNTQ